MAKMTTLSYGGTAAIVTSMGLVVGLETAASSRAAVVSGLLVVAVADNLSDSLAIHMYQESEQLDAGRAFRSTVVNFVVRFLVATTFVLLALLLPLKLLVPVALCWGTVLLGTLTYLIARDRRISPAVEIGKHLAAAVVIIGVSRALAGWIVTHVS